MTSPDSMMEKVRALFARADHPNTPPAEAETATALAHKIMAKYMIEEAEVRTASGSAPQEIVSVKLIMPNPFSKERANGWGRFAELLGCKAVLRRSNYETWRGRKVSYGATTLHLFGRRDQLDRLELLIGSLNTQVTHGLFQFRGTRVSRKITRSYVIGFTEKVWLRMCTILEAQKTESGAQRAAQFALVLMDDYQRANRAMEQELGEIGKTVMARAERAGLLLGARDGERADIGQDSLGHARAAIGAAS